MVVPNPVLCVLPQRSRTSQSRRTRGFGTGRGVEKGRTRERDSSLFATDWRELARLEYWVLGDPVGRLSWAREQAGMLETRLST